MRVEFVEQQIERGEQLRRGGDEPGVCRMILGTIRTGGTEGANDMCTV